MISKNEAKFVKSLQIKKFRDQHQLFVVEGGKSVLELLNSDYKIAKVLATEEFIYKHNKTLSKFSEVVVTVDEDCLSNIGSFSSNNSALAVANQRHFQLSDINFNESMVVLDNLKDPGNLGTIIRTADWFGIRQVVCSSSSTEVFNPKVTNSTMGSLGRARVVYTDLPEFFGQRPHLNVYAAVLGGERLDLIHKKTPFCLVIGNESNGISSEVLNHIDQKVTIPDLGGTAESLNASVACGILLYELTRIG